MLAPVNKLWTTPHKAVERGLQLLELERESRLLDPGCGDGRVLLRAAQQYGCQCHGYEINTTRAAQTAEAVKEAGMDELIKIHAESSLDAEFSSFDAVFGFLVERGLRKVVPLMLKAASDRITAFAPGPHKLDAAKCLPEVPLTTLPPAAACASDGQDCPEASQAHSSESRPVVKFLSVLYRVPPGLCSEPVRVEWVASSELVKTPVYLYHFYGDERDKPVTQNSGAGDEQSID